MGNDGRIARCTYCRLCNGMTSLIWSLRSKSTYCRDAIRCQVRSQPATCSRKQAASSLGRGKLRGHKEGCKWSASTCSSTITLDAFRRAGLENGLAHARSLAARSNTLKLKRNWKRYRKSWSGVIYPFFELAFVSWSTGRASSRSRLTWATNSPAHRGSPGYHPKGP